MFVSCILRSFSLTMGNEIPRFNPIFVLPVCAQPDIEPTSHASSPLRVTPGRRTGTGSAAVSSSTRTPTPRAKVLGFRSASLLSMLSATGHIPGEFAQGAEFSSFEAIRAKADRPLVVFPECTSSNGRGMLRFAEVFTGVSVPVRRFKVFVMCVR